MSCDRILCGSEELYSSLDGFRRSVELLAAVWYNVARMIGRDDVAGAIEEAVRRYVENVAAEDYRVCVENCRYDGSPGCSDDCRRWFNEKVEDLMNQVLGRKPEDGREEEGESGW